MEYLVEHLVEIATKQDGFSQSWTFDEATFGEFETKYLNERASEGWRLVTVVGTRTNTIYYFSRQKSEQSLDNSPDS